MRKSRLLSLLYIFGVVIDSQSYTNKDKEYVQHRYYCSPGRIELPPQKLMAQSRHSIFAENSDTADYDPDEPFCRIAHRLFAHTAFALGEIIDHLV